MSLDEVLSGSPLALEDLGGSWDQAVKDAVLGAAPSDFEHLTIDETWAVIGWAERCASVALASGDSEWTVAGARGVILVRDVVDPRDRRVVLELLAYAATELVAVRDVARRLPMSPTSWRAPFEERDIPPPTHTVENVGGRRVLARVETWDPLDVLKDFLD